MDSTEPPARIRIRCPGCGKDGAARAELMGRRLTCKHCKQAFRALPADQPGRPADPDARAGSAEAAELRERLARALEAAGKAEARQAGEIAGLRDRLEAERASLRTTQAELDRARAELEEARLGADRATGAPISAWGSSRTEIEPRAAADDAAVTFFAEGEGATPPGPASCPGVEAADPGPAEAESRVLSPPPPDADRRS